jgi:hypothetical protein
MILKGNFILSIESDEVVRFHEIAYLEINSSVEQRGLILHEENINNISFFRRRYNLTKKKDAAFDAVLYQDGANVMEIKEALVSEIEPDFVLLSDSFEIFDMSSVEGIKMHAVSSRNYEIIKRDLDLTSD